jgi:restriction endonuclease S subunit
MKYNKFRFDEITLNYDKKRIPLSAMERTKRQGAFRYFGAQGVIDYVDDYIFDGKYLLIAEDGENLKSKRQNIAQIVEGKFWVNNHAHIVQCNDKCILEYLAYLINGKDVSGYITGSAQPKLSQANLNAMEFDIPSIKEQQDILSILLPIEQKIRINKEINNNLEQQAQAIFDSMFPNITNGENTIGDTITPKRGKGLLSKNAVFGNVPVVAGGLEPSTYHNTANTKAPVLAISASGANAGFVSLWNIPIWSSDSSFIDSSMTDDVYFWYVLLKKRQREIYDSQTGSAQPHIYPQHIAAMPISDLNFDDVRNYTSIVTPIFEMIGHNKDENARLATTRDTLLPKLMSGELDVSDIDL